MAGVQGLEGEGKGGEALPLTQSKVLVELLAISDRRSRKFGDSAKWLCTALFPYLISK